MNELEKALTSIKDDDLDFYLEMTHTGAIRRDIEEIKRKAADGTDATSKIAAIKNILLQEP